MSLQTALSGLNGAQSAIDTASNDLANANTTGFKSQTALFGDVFPAGSSNVPGIGVTTQAIQSDFTQGDVAPTGDPLDAAIQGNGFFITSQNGTQQFTRDGAFNLSPTGELVSATGAPVLGFSGTSTSGQLSPITVNTGAVPANATANLTLALNLDSNDAATSAVVGATSNTFNPTVASTFNSSTSATVFDSLGNANNVQLFFQEASPAATGAAASWNVYSQTPAQAAQAATDEAAGNALTAGANGTGDFSFISTLNFNSSGQLLAQTPPAGSGLPSGNVNTSVTIPGIGGAANTIFNLSFAGTTLGAQSFAVTGNTNLGANGAVAAAPGSFSGVTFSSNGAVQATYTNGATVTAGTLAIANFINQQGLTPVSGNLFAQSSTSGTPVVDTPGTGQAGSIAGGNLESSNVSTSSLLVSLIQFQQAYQANAFDIQTEQQDSTRLTQI
jgi:flagellar hook protein FlgE